MEEANRADERKYLGKLLDTTGIAENVEAVKDAASRPIAADEAKKLETDAKVSGIMDATILLKKIEEVKALAAAATPTPAQQAAAAPPVADKVLSSLVDSSNLTTAVTNVTDAVNRPSVDPEV